MQKSSFGSLFGRDILADFHDRMNALIELAAGPPPAEDRKTAKKSAGKKGGSGEFVGVQGMFRFFSAEGTKAPLKVRNVSIRGEMEPSDGHPQEELTPDFALFRPLAFNNMTWTLYWPELIV